MDRKPAVLIVGAQARAGYGQVKYADGGICCFSDEIHGKVLVIACQGDSTK